MSIEVSPTLVICAIRIEEALNKSERSVVEDRPIYKVNAIGDNRLYNGSTNEEGYGWPQKSREPAWLIKENNAR